VSPVHPENALLPRVVTPTGIVTPVSLLRPENAELRMLLTLDGIV